MLVVGNKMHLLIRSHRFLFITIFLSIVFWFVESSLHFLVFNQEDHFEIIPHDFNELWMRIVICILIIVTGAIADMYIRTLHKVQEEKLRTLKATMYNVHNIAGNALNQISLLCDDDSIQQVISDTTAKLKEISDAEEVIEEKNSQGIYKIKVTRPCDEDQVR